MLTRARKGFTLLELIVVLVILGLLAAIAIPTYQRIISESEATSVKETAKAFSRNVLAIAALDQISGATPRDSAVVDAADDELDASAVISYAETVPGTVDDGEVTVTVGGVGGPAACATLPATNGGTFTVAAGAC